MKMLPGSGRAGELWLVVPLGGGRTTRVVRGRLWRRIRASIKKTKDRRARMGRRF